MEVNFVWGSDFYRVGNVLLWKKAGQVNPDFPGKVSLGNQQDKPG
jgi:hypothetical protein